jgi:glutamyl-tRNA synthetase
LFSREQLVQWFDGQHLSKSPAQWDAAKLNWVNAHYIKHSDDAALALLASAQLARRGIRAEPPETLSRMCALYKDRCTTTVELADWLAMYFAAVSPSADDLKLHVPDAVRPAVSTLCSKLATADWTKPAISAAIKEALAAHGLKMPQLAHAVRVLVCGRAQTPSIDAVLELFTRQTVLERLRSR